MPNSFSIIKSTTGQHSSNIDASENIVFDPAIYLRNPNTNNEVKKNENDMEELDEIDRKVIFSSSL